MASLNEGLAAIRRTAEGDGTKPGRVPADFLRIMHRVTADQRASGFQGRMPGLGQSAPAFALPNQDGATVRSTDLLARGPLIVSFFRGQW
jgi:hypothetical protein